MKTTRSPARAPSPWRPVRLGIAALVGVLVLGTIAYWALGLGPFDAFYQTLITVSTVGFTEVGDHSGAGFRLVSSVLILVGVGVALYTIGAAFEAIMEGRLLEHMGRARLQHTLDQLKGHTIVCGWGQVGQAISNSLRAQQTEVVVIDRREDLHEVVDSLAVIGNATDDEVLRRAGIERARGLVVALDSDADCVYVALSGRALNPDLFIVARANSAEAEPKLRQAGADRIVRPHVIGGSRMASFVLQPNVADFLDEAMGDESMEVRLEEFPVSPETLQRCTCIGDSGFSESSGIMVMAIRHPDATFVPHPAPEAELEAGDVVIVLGTSEQLDGVRSWLAGGDLPGPG
jgi:voltage-gated potassium channel